MTSTRLTRRALLRGVVVTTAGAGLAAALPGTARADGTNPPPGPAVDPLGADTPGELGASLSGMERRLAAPPVQLTIPATPAAAVPVTAALPYKNFLRYDFELRTLPPELQAYALTAPMPAGYGVVDSTGVRMVDRAGTLWNHPAAQAQYGMALLESYRLTQDERFLTLALTQAGRLIKRAHAYGGGLFHPYDFRYSPHSTAVRVPPWYSAIAQGQVLDFFTRLHAVTGNAGHKAEADGTFQSFLVPQAAGKPWVTWVQSGHLWLDEYPRTDVALGDRTYNGHTFASFGLYQYYQATKDERARQLVQGAFATARAVASQVRNPGWRSVYCLQDRHDSLAYHETHVLQHLLISTITGDSTFAAAADLFHADFPDPTARGTVVMEKGTHPAYVFDSLGRVPASRLLSVATVTSAPCGTRTKIVNHAGMWYQITAGTLTGYWVQESPGWTFLRGKFISMPYLPYRTGTLTSAVATAVQPAPAAGQPLPSKPVALAKGTSVLVDQRALIDAVEYVELADPTNAGWWIPAAAVSF